MSRPERSVGNSLGRNATFPAAAAVLLLTLLTFGAVLFASASPRGAAAQQTESATKAAKGVPVLPPSPLQPKVQTACLECHDAGIIMQQRLDKKNWTKEVDKMIRWGAVVDAKDRDAFIEYFSEHFGPTQASPDAKN
jgi:hypothetical protein